MLGGAGSWASLARFVGVDVVLTAAADSLVPETPREQSVEECISKGVFGKENNVFDMFRKEATMIPAKDNKLIAQVNGQLRNKIPVINFSFMDWSKKENEKPAWMKNYSMPGKERKEQYKDVPLVVAPGYEDAYLKEQEMLKDNTESEVREQTMKIRKHRQADTTDKMSKTTKLPSVRGKKRKNKRNIPIQTAGTGFCAHSVLTEWEKWPVTWVIS